MDWVLILAWMPIVGITSAFFWMMKTSIGTSEAILLLLTICWFAWGVEYITLNAQQEPPVAETHAALSETPSENKPLP